MFAIVVVMIGVIVTAVLSFWWIDREQARREAAEDAEFAEQIKHLPPEKQAELWMTVHRHRGE